MPPSESASVRGNFIHKQIDADLAAGACAAVVTRFPPEPNGYLHIGHAKAIALNFGIAAAYDGECTLRLDDTNPDQEDAAYADAICEDVRWLGYRWRRLTHASDYFDQLYEFARRLTAERLAYVDRQSAAAMRANRGTLTTPGTPSADRERSAEENLDLLARMKSGEFADGEMVLRARIDLASPNLNLRDPVLYRIRRRHHQRTGDAWCIYPLYDFTHGQSDALEGVSHSLCTLEFEDHRALYDWFLERLVAPPRPRQIEFSRLNLSHTVMSKRLLTQLVVHRDVDGWDDPRLPTLCALRRRGFTAAAIRRFISLVGVTRSANVIEMGLLENCVREDLEPQARRALAVLEPLKLIIDNYPAGAGETLRAPNHPADPAMGEREITLSRELYIERDDFSLEPPSKFFRLAPGRSVRLRYAFVVRCVAVEHDAAGRVSAVHCEHDPATRGGAHGAGGKVKGIIHWVNAADSPRAEVRLIDRLFTAPDPLAAGDDWRATLNPDSLQLRQARVEASLADAEPGTRIQFERLGYFHADRDSRADGLVFNRIVTLRDTWGKIAAAATTTTTET